MQRPELTNQTILVTWWAGFLGSHLCEKLLNNNSKIICVDNMQTGFQENIDIFANNPNYTFIKADCNNYDQMKKIFEENTINYAFHHAATVGVKLTNEKPLQVLKDADGIKYICKLCLEYKIGKLVFASSSEVYGEPQKLPESEDDPVSPHIPYAVVKLYGEHYLQSYYTQKWLRTTSVRFFNVYWPRQIWTAYGFVAGIFMNQVNQNQSPTIFRDGTQTRNFVFVDDNVNATITALTNKESDGEVINIWTGKPVTIVDLAEKIIKISGKNLKPKFVPTPDDNRVNHRFPDISKMKKLLKYDPQFTLDEGLKITYDRYLENNPPWVPPLKKGA